MVINNSSKFLLLDSETGEIINMDGKTCYVRSDEDRKRVKEYFAKQADEKQRINEAYKKYGGFIWSLYGISQESFPNIKPSNITRLMFVSTYIGYDGFLVTKKNVPITKEAMFELLHLSQKECYRFFEEMVANGIMYEEDSKIYINTDYFKKGDIELSEIAKMAKDNVYFTRIYIEAIRSLYRSATPRSHKTLSYLFQIIPYVNREYNVVCFNPLEKDFDSIELMRLGDFCDIVGYDKSHANRLFRLLFEPTFNINGEEKSAMRYVVDKSLSKLDFSMFINPRVYYAGTHWYEVEILGKF